MILKYISNQPVNDLHFRRDLFLLLSEFIKFKCRIAVDTYSTGEHNLFHNI